MPTIQVDPLKADFKNFLFVVWMHLGLPAPTPEQYDIADYLQYGPRRAGIMAFRGVGKSWITVAYVCWVLYCDPQEKVLVVSASAPLANEFSSMVKGLISSMDILAHLRPKPDQRQSMTAFDVGPALPDKAPSVKSIGLTGQIAGSRATKIVADDIEIPKNSDTEGKREKLKNDIKEFDAVIKPGGKIIFLGTPQTEQSIYAELSNRGYVFRIWPALYPEDPEGKLEPVPYAEQLYGGRLAPYIMERLTEGATGSTDPLRFSKEDLDERLLSYGRSGFQLQFQLNTALSDADKYPLRCSDLIVHPLDPHRGPSDLVWASSPDLRWGDELPLVGLQGDRYYRPAWVSKEYLPYSDTIMWIDPSGKGQDETAYAVVKFLNGRLFLTAVGGFLAGYEEDTLKGLLDVARKQHVNKILIEPNFGGGMFAQLLRGASYRHYPVAIEDGEWSSAQKETRIIDTLEPVMNQHKLVISPEVIAVDYASVERYSAEKAHYYRLMYQLTHMVKERGALARDDRIDALAAAVAYFTPALSMDSERAHMEAKEDALNTALLKFMNNALGKQAIGRPYASSVLSRGAFKQARR